jgi:Fic family protein
MDRLLAVSTAGAWEPWIAFFLTGVVECARESLRFTDELLALRDRYQDAVRSARSSGLLAKLVDRLFQVPSITIAQARDLLSVTHASASSNLQKLVALGIVVEVTGRTRDRMYVAREILGFVGRDLGPADSSGSS